MFGFGLCLQFLSSTVWPLRRDRLRLIASGNRWGRCKVAVRRAFAVSGNRAASWEFYSPEAFNVSGLGLSLVIFGFSMLQMM
jgi:hypothetical protein